MQPATISQGARILPLPIRPAGLFVSYTAWGYASFSPSDWGTRHLA